MSVKFYGTESDPNVAKDMILAQPQLFISQQLYAGSGVAGIVSDDVTLTPATSPAWTSSALVSAVGKNIVVQGDGGEVFEGPVKANTATAVTFDATDMISRDTGLAGAPADFTAASTYYFYILEPHATAAWGSYFGFAKELELNAEEEYADFDYGTPAESIRSDLVKTKFSMKGKSFNPLNEDVFQAVFNGVQKGLQTTQWERHLGFAPGVRPFYRITAIGKTVEDKDILIQMFLGQFKLESGLSLSSNEHKSVGFSVMAKKESLSPANANIGRFRVEK